MSRDATQESAHATWGLYARDVPRDDPAECWRVRVGLARRWRVVVSDALAQTRAECVASTSADPSGDDGADPRRSRLGQGNPSPRVADAPP